MEIIRHHPVGKALENRDERAKWLCKFFWATKIVENYLNIVSLQYAVC